MAVANPGSIERMLVEALDEPALIVTGSGVLTANEPARRVLGERIEGRDIRLAIRHPRALELILAHAPGEVEATGIAEFGRSWRVVIRALGPSSSLVRLIDRSEAVSAERMRVDFVANASHELRTPLSTVLGYAETLSEDGELPSDVRASFGRTIHDEAQRMLRIIEDLISLSRIEADRYIAPAEIVDVGDVVRTAAANASHARCELVVHLDTDLPPVHGDAGQLVQVLDNLIGNALRYGCDHSYSRVEVNAMRSGECVELQVIDKGPGIGREHLPRLTERFYRADPARSREKGGTGLGLAIVKHIIERHRGVLEIRSTVGVGTSVIVRLPVA